MDESKVWRPARLEDAIREKPVACRFKLAYPPWPQGPEESKPRRLDWIEGLLCGVSRIWAGDKWILDTWFQAIETDTGCSYSVRICEVCEEPSKLAYQAKLDNLAKLAGLVCDECGGAAFKIRNDAANVQHVFCKEHWELHVAIPSGMRTGDQRD